MIFQGFASRGEGIITLLLVKPIYIYFYVLFSLSLFFLAENNRTNWWKLFKEPV